MRSSHSEEPFECLAATTLAGTPTVRQNQRDGRRQTEGRGTEAERWQRSEAIRETSLESSFFGDQLKRKSRQADSFTHVRGVQSTAPFLRRSELSRQSLFVNAKFGLPPSACAFCSRGRPLLTAFRGNRQRRTRQWWRNASRESLSTTRVGRQRMEKIAEALQQNRSVIKVHYSHNFGMEDSCRDTGTGA